MKDYTMSDLGVFVGIIGSSLALLIGAIQKSKCETIDCCGIKCKRDPKIKSTDSVPISPLPIVKP
jgi:hypothetical protein